MADGRNEAIAIIEKHIPSITNAIEEEEVDSPLWEVTNELYMILGYAGPKRECSCGQRLDGFYEYVDHLKEMLRV
jgi:hypothetical protein